MARTTATVAFNAIELKGSLLPGSLLDQVARLGAKHQYPKDYGLEKNERLRDRIDAAWVLAKDLWAEYVGLKERAGQGVAGLHFSLRLLREVFEWDDVQPVKVWQRGVASYPITHRAFGGAVPLIIKGVDSADLDRGLRDFGQESRKRSPHSCLQECLNADDNSDWGLLITGDRLRLLHDNPSLVKPAYLGADLEWMIEGDLFDEFAVLWLTLHASRFRHPADGNCVLDGWKQEAEDTGERILGQLRGGVQTALEELGNGVLAHHANQRLREALENGELSRQAFQEELLRLVYRFLFLFTAEDRELLFSHEVGKDDPRRQIYHEGYSVGRLRELALKRSTYEGNYGDLWELQRLVFQQLSISHSPLGLPGLGGLFAEEQCPNLRGCELDNRFLLRAIKAIGWFDAGGTLTRVNYRDLNTEELGSVYEGLLELHPQVEQKGGKLQLSYGGGAGSDRKTTGSYYTPDDLVKLLIESALLPVIQQRLSQAATPEAKIKALLAIRVLDPACGSGHFLLAAGRRLALELARLRAGNDEPSEALRQQCLREVVAHCLFGVDKNPMAVQLCKVALWIEAIDPGKPLSFLDAHIQYGDSLVGVFDPKVLEEGIPDEAYKPLTGDDKTVCTSLKKDNATARRNISRRGSNRGIQGSLVLTGYQPRSRGQQELQTIEAMPDATLAESSAKQAAYAQWLADRGQDPETLAADLFTAAFFLPKTSEARARVPTTGHLLKLLAPQRIYEAIEEAVVQTAETFRFFHWHLRFGEVMARGGFDCVLGNPPWEVSQLNEVEFFSSLKPELAKLTGTRRKKAIAELEVNDPMTWGHFIQGKREIESCNAFYRCGQLPLCAQGKMNTYQLFAEQFLKLMKSAGRAGLITPSGIATDYTCREFFEYITGSKKLVCFMGFDNALKAFPGVHPDTPFSLMTLGSVDSEPIYAHYLLRVEDIADKRRLFTIGTDGIFLLNPNTKTCPVFRSEKDAYIAKKIYSSVPVLVNEALGEKGNPWGLRFRQGLFNMTSDSGFFLDEPGLNRLPLYEAKYIHIYDHRWASSDPEGSGRDVSISEKQDPCFEIISRYWVEKGNVEQKLSDISWNRNWLLGWRGITNATNERSVIASIIPRVGVGHSCHLVMPSNKVTPLQSCALFGNISCLVFDYFARQKIGGTNFNFYIPMQLPAMPPDVYTQEGLRFIGERVLELTYTSHDLKPWAQDLGYDGPPFIFDPDRRSLLRAELDAYYAHLYGLSRDELRYILDPADVMGPDYPSETFRVLKTNEIREFGEYRTQRLVLEAWDRLFGG